MELQPLPSGESPLAALVNVANFVPTKLHWLSESQIPNYVEWKEQMECLIRSQGLMHYIDGTISLPLGPKQDYGVWERTNALVRGWILGSLSDEIVSTVVDYPNAHQVWAYLYNKFGQKYDQPQIILIHQKVKCLNDSSLLHKAVLEGDWEKTNQIFDADPMVMTDWIDDNEHSRPLHIAVAAGQKAVRLVKNILRLLSDNELLVLTDSRDSTALHTAAAVGNIEAAAVLAQRVPELCYKLNKYGNYPIHSAALYRQRETLEYLIPHTGVTDEHNPYDGSEGQLLLTYLIQSEFFDIALRLADHHHSLLQTPCPDEGLPLTLLTTKINAMNIRDFNRWEHFISKWLLPSETTWIRRDLEICRTNNARHIFSVLWLDFQLMLQRCIELLVPQMKETKSKRRKNQYAQQLLEQMCVEIGNQNFKLASEIFHDAAFVAAELGVREVVEVIMDTFPGVIYSKRKPSGQHILHEAIENRSVDVFKLIYERTDQKYYFTSYFNDNYGNTPLHAAGKLAPTHKLNETSGAALQFQRELQWFKEVEKVVHPHSGEELNTNGKTPRMVFTEEHKFLKEAGEKWMKETTTSLTLVATLIATVMFTGAHTAPGGNDDHTGYPILLDEPAFVIFAVSDVVSLFTSITSLLFFLAILTSRYAEEDFLHSLPSKLIFGLATLFLSMVSMMISFIAALYSLYGGKADWVIFPLLIFASMPAASFALCHCPLLRVLIHSTYGGGIFRKKHRAL